MSGRFSAAQRMWPCSIRQRMRSHTWRWWMRARLNWCAQRREGGELADLVQKYEACWSDEQLESHRSAGAAIDRIVREAFQHAAKTCARKGRSRIRFEALDLAEFDAAGIWAEEGPDIAVNAHASDPHYGPRRSPRADPRRRFAALDVWGKRKRLAASTMSYVGRVSWRQSAGKYGRFLELSGKLAIGLSI